MTEISPGVERPEEETIKSIKDEVEGTVDTHVISGSIDTTVGKVGRVGTVGHQAGSIEVHGTVSTTVEVGKIGRVGTVGHQAGSIEVHGSVSTEVSQVSRIGTVAHDYIEGGSVGVSGQPVDTHVISGSIDTTVKKLSRVGSVVYNVDSAGSPHPTATKEGNVPVSGSVGVVEIPSITGTVETKGISEVSGTVEVSTLPTDRHITSGSIDISNIVSVKERAGTPVEVHPGTTPVTGDFYPSTQQISGTVETTGITQISGTIEQETLSRDVTGSVGVKELPYTVQVGSPAVTAQRVHSQQGSIGVIELPSISGTVETEGIAQISGTVEQKSIDRHVTSGSVGILEQPINTDVTGSVGVKGQPVDVKTKSGTPAIVSGSIGVEGQPISTNTTGSVGVKELPSVSGSVGIKGQPTQVTTKTGTPVVVDQTTLDRHVTSGSVGVTTMPSITGTVETKGITDISGTVEVSNVVTVKERAGTPVEVHPGTTPVTGDFYPSVQQISGTVETEGITQISGTVEQKSTDRHITSGSIDSSIVGQPIETDKSRVRTANYGSIPVGTTVTTILEPNTNRKSLLVQNTGTPNVFIGFDNSLTIDNGIVLNGAGTPGAGGGHYTNDDYTGSVTGITESTTSTVRFVED